MEKNLKAGIYIVAILAVFGVVMSSYFAIKSRSTDARVQDLLQERETLVKEIDAKKAELAISSTTVSELETELKNIREDLEELADEYNDEKDKNDEFEDQLRGLAGTVGDLDKLAKTDKELLAKYSKVYFLNENYNPARLKKIDSDYVLSGRQEQFFLTDAMDHLEEMLDDAEDDGIDLKVISAYRSFDQQTELKGQYTQVYGSGANAFSADQGYSEHQLGTTVDLTIPSIGGAYDSFAKTDAYVWLNANAYKYGFILSYPENNNFYVFEPWHWRFVGTELARDLHRSGKTFYDLDQRELNEYLLNFFD